MIGNFSLKKIARKDLQHNQEDFFLKEAKRLFFVYLIINYQARENLIGESIMIRT